LNKHRVLFLFTNLFQDHDAETLVVVDQHVGAQMAAGFLAGTFMVIFTNPLDVVKTRLQTQHTMVRL
jgi:hypothetical protein